ncbi:hypothetical protein RchiOBHm_Chr5g0052711 [Rosa chinensis]|uniref:Uncharacterized protein n=1 Tax=Rosa chinensis TaxID=74649 RepID=A0A2P6QFR3_ROSCH|nr:hypothetical protein RchiOBHm_Chr5g0052711 [Rosa chinensis]
MISTPEGMPCQSSNSVDTVRHHHWSFDSSFGTLRHAVLELNDSRAADRWKSHPLLSCFLPLLKLLCSSPPSPLFPFHEVLLYCTDLEFGLYKT